MASLAPLALAFFAAVIFARGHSHNRSSLGPVHDSAGAAPSLVENVDRSINAPTQAAESHRAPDPAAVHSGAMSRARVHQHPVGGDRRIIRPPAAEVALKKAAGKTASKDAGRGYVAAEVDAQGQYYPETYTPGTDPYGGMPGYGGPYSEGTSSYGTYGTGYSSYGYPSTVAGSGPYGVMCVVPYWSEDESVCKDKGEKETSSSSSSTASTGTYGTYGTSSYAQQTQQYDPYGTYGTSSYGTSDPYGTAQQTVQHVQDTWEEAMECEVVCPSWWQVPSIEKMTCEGGVWLNEEEDEVKKISCGTAGWIYLLFLLLVGVVTYIIVDAKVLKPKRDALAAAGQQDVNVNVNVGGQGQYPADPGAPPPPQ